MWNKITEGGKHFGNYSFLSSRGGKYIEREILREGDEIWDSGALQNLQHIPLILLGKKERRAEVGQVLE